MAGTYSLDWSTDKEPVSYQPGETMTFHIQLLEDGKPLAGKTLKWQRTGDDQKTAEGQGVSSETAALKITTSIDEPGFVRIQVGVFNDDGSPVKDERNKAVRFDGGAGVQPTKLEGYPEPADFDTFWKAQEGASGGRATQGESGAGRFTQSRIRGVRRKGRLCRRDARLRLLLEAGWCEGQVASGHGELSGLRRNGRFASCAGRAGFRCRSTRTASKTVANRLTTTR